MRGVHLDEEEVVIEVSEAVCSTSNSTADQHVMPDIYQLASQVHDVDLALLSLKLCREVRHVGPQLQTR
jgi:hypothetical protein